MAQRIRRPIGKVFTAVSQAEGDGARVKRTIGTRHLRNLQPFLMLDEFDVKPPGGFPDHPHRGQETVTYLLDGEFFHADNKGHKGHLLPGDVQWMTAGRGVVHSETPGPHGGRGLQLWVNLKSKDKMMPARYQELAAAEIPKAEKDGVAVTVIAGEALGVAAKVFTVQPTMYLDFTLQPAKQHFQSVPDKWNGFVYVISGKGKINGHDVSSSQMATLPASPADGDTGVEAENTGSEALRFVLVAGEPIDEPCIQYGPFVMNTEEEIYKAMHDYQSGKF